MSPVAVVIAPNVTSYKFEGLVGNTTYRISVEGFSNKRSVFYTSTLISTSLAGNSILSSEGKTKLPKYVSVNMLSGFSNEFSENKFLYLFRERNTM